MPIQPVTYRIIAVARVQEKDELQPEDVAEIFEKLDETARSEFTQARFPNCKLVLEHEVASSSHNFPKIIYELSQRGLNPIAGAIRDIEDAVVAMSAGAKKIVGPVYSNEVAEFADDYNLRYTPGAFTVNEVTTTQDAVLKRGLGGFLNIFPTYYHGSLGICEAIKSMYSDRIGNRRVLSYLSIDSDSTQNQIQVHSATEFDRVIQKDGNKKITVSLPPGEILDWVDHFKLIRNYVSPGIEPIAVGGITPQTMLPLLNICNTSFGMSWLFNQALLSIKNQDKTLVSAEVAMKKAIKAISDFQCT